MIPVSRERRKVPSCSFINFWDASIVPNVATACRTIPRVKIKRVRHVCVGSYNVMSQSEDRRLPHLSDEFSMLKVNMVDFSETRRPGSSETSSRDIYTGMSNGHIVKGVTIGISSRL